MVRFLSRGAETYLSKNKLIHLRPDKIGVQDSFPRCQHRLFNLLLYILFLTSNFAAFSRIIDVILSLQLHMLSMKLKTVSPGHKCSVS